MQCGLSVWVFFFVELRGDLWFSSHGNIVFDLHYTYPEENIRKTKLFVNTCKIVVEYEDNTPCMRMKKWFFLMKKHRTCSIQRSNPLVNELMYTYRFTRLFNINLFSCKQRLLNRLYIRLHEKLIKTRFFLLHLNTTNAVFDSNRFDAMDSRCAIIRLVLPFVLIGKLRKLMKSFLFVYFSVQKRSKSKILKW